MAVDPWEWLSLVDREGPFLSKAALKSFYPSGLPRPDAGADEVNATFVDAFARWSAAWGAAPDAYPEARDRWVTTVLRDLLGWEDDLDLGPGAGVESPNGTVTTSAWAALRGDSGPAALVTVVDRTDDLRSVGTDGWSANAVDRMAVLLRHTGVPVGIVTDGRWWALVSAAKDVTTASGVWDAMLWREERASRDAFFALAHFTSLAGGSPEKRLHHVFARSVTSAEEITEALGDQVRRAVELVLQSMSDTHLRALAQGHPSPLPENPKTVYEGAVTVLMRIVFLLFAEERGLLPEHQLYRDSYAISRVREKLQREATDATLEALDHSWETWHRLLAASNAVFGGATFQDMRMPAYGGSLFDPERFPWLYATDDQGLLRVRVSDRAMLAVLRAVQTIEDGAMQLSFRDLDVEQIGYVYEGLLGYSADYVADVTVGLHGKAGFEPEIPLTELEQIVAEASSEADFAKRLVEHLKKTQEQAKPRTANQIAKAYAIDDAEVLADARTRLRHALLGDDELAGRLQPFHGLIRDDLRGFPYVVPAGGLVMTESPQRANTGTHYTPRSLAEEVVQHALEPLVYSPGPLDVEDRNEWKLKSSSDILDLKVADIAAGSGAFLVAAARYLADRLLEARKAEGLDSEGESDLKRWAIREVVARCLYGADINGMAVEMCKLSLWLISMDPGKPFSFVDDRVFHGNSLLGVTTEAQLRAQHIYPERRRGQGDLLRLDVEKDLDDAARIRVELASGQADDADRMRSTKAKQALLAQAKQVTAKLRAVADGIVAAGLLEGGSPGSRLDTRYALLADAVREAYQGGPGTTSQRTKLDAITEQGLKPTASTGEARWTPVHWVLEAPDVFRVHGGFDAIIGNPPFVGSRFLSGKFGPNMREWCGNVVAAGSVGLGDYFAYFVRRAAELANGKATIGLLCKDALTARENRRVAITPLLDRGMSIFGSIGPKPWPTQSAHLRYVVFFGTWGEFSGRARHNGRYVDAIAGDLAPSSRVATSRSALEANAGKAFVGSYPNGRGFRLSVDAAQAMIERRHANAEVIWNYLTSADLASRQPNVAGERIINFGRLEASEAAAYREPFSLVEQLVKPERASKSQVRLREYWWQYKAQAEQLYTAVADLSHFIAIAQDGKNQMPVRVENAGHLVVDTKVIAIATEEWSDFAVLSSTHHRLWAAADSHGLIGALKYLPRSFESFPRPDDCLEELGDLGRALHTAQVDAMDAMELGFRDLYSALATEPAPANREAKALLDIHRQLDLQMMVAYGWSDIAPEFEPMTTNGVRQIGFDENSRNETLARLNVLNLSRSTQTPTRAPALSVDARDKPEGAMF